MTKAELAAQVAEQAGLSKAQAAAAVEAVFGAITAALRRGDKVQLVGFGSFEVRQRKARPGRNPRTQEAITIPGGKLPVFHAGKQLKEAVEGGG